MYRNSFTYFLGYLKVLYLDRLLRGFAKEQHHDLFMDVSQLEERVRDGYVNALLGLQAGLSN